MDAQKDEHGDGQAMTLDDQLAVTDTAVADTADTDGLSAASIFDAFCDPEELMRRAMSPEATTGQIITALDRCLPRHRDRIAMRYANNGGDDPVVFASLAVDPVREIRVHAARSHHTPIESMDLLSLDRSYWIRQVLALNPACPQRIYRRFVTDESEHVRVALGGRELSDDDVYRLAHDPARSVRARIAQRETLSDELVRHLAVDDERDVRARIAQRPGPPDVLEALAADPDPMVVLQIARNADAPIRALRRASHCYEVQVREYLVMHPAGHEEVFELLAADPSDLIRRRAALFCGHEPVLMRLVGDCDHSVRAALANNAQATSAVLEAIAPPLNVHARSGLLRNAAATGDLAWAHLADADWGLRRLARACLRDHLDTLAPERRTLLESVADRLIWPGDLSGVAPSVRSGAPEGTVEGTVEPDRIDDPGVLYWLLDTADDSPALWAAALDPSIPMRLRIDILERSDVPVEVVAAAARDRHREIRAIAAAHGELPLECAHRLAIDRSVAVRLSLAENVDVAREVLLRLRRDHEPLVVSTASATLRERARLARAARERAKARAANRRRWPTTPRMPKVRVPRARR
jgi:hypothetical protein